MATSLRATSLWRSAFEATGADATQSEQAFFRLHLESMREKAKVLVARIAADMPGYTVKLTRFRGARQAFNGGFSDAQDASALFT